MFSKLLFAIPESLQMPDGSPSKIVAYHSVPPFLVIKDPAFQDFIVFINGVPLTAIRSLMLMNPADPNRPCSSFDIATEVDKKLANEPSMSPIFNQVTEPVALGSFHIIDANKEHAVRSMTAVYTTFRPSPVITPNPASAAEMAFVRKPDSWPNHASGITGVPWTLLFEPLGYTLSPVPSTPLVIRPSDIVGRYDVVTDKWVPPHNTDKLRKCIVCGALGESSGIPAGLEVADLVKPLKTCGKCKSVWYCTRQCQVEHWKEHKKVCTILAMKRAKEDEKQKAGEGVKDLETKQESKEGVKTKDVEKETQC